MKNNINREIRKDYGFTLIIVSSIIGIAFLLAMLSPLYRSNSFNWHKDFVADEIETSNAEFLLEDGSTHIIDGEETNSILIYYEFDTARPKWEFRSIDEAIADYTENGTENQPYYLFLITTLSLDFGIDHGKEKYMLNSSEANFVYYDLNLSDEYSNPNIDLSTMYVDDNIENQAEEKWFVGPDYTTAIETLPLTVETSSNVEEIGLINFKITK